MVSQSAPVWAHLHSKTHSDRRGSPRFKPLNVIPAAFGATGWRLVGHIVNISTTGVSIQNHCNNHDHVEITSLQFDQPLTNHAVQLIIEQGRGSAVHWEPGKAVVHGTLGIRVLNEVLQATAEGRLIDMRHVSQIDNAGIGVALLTLDQRGTLTSCHANIRELLSASGVCYRCTGACNLSGKRK